jgi:hypothetical protein
MERFDVVLTLLELEAGRAVATRFVSNKSVDKPRASVRSSRDFFSIILIDNLRV